MKMFIVEQKGLEIIKVAIVDSIGYSTKYYIIIKDKDNFDNKNIGAGSYLSSESKLSKETKDNTFIFDSEKQACDFLLAWIDNNKCEDRIKTDEDNKEITYPLKKVKHKEDAAINWKNNWKTGNSPPLLDIENIKNKGSYSLYQDGCKEFEKNLKESLKTTVKNIRKQESLENLIDYDMDNF